MIVFRCPLCNAVLSECKGTKIDENDGITLWCENKQCPAQEVFGHAQNKAGAFYVIQEKYKATQSSD